MKRMRIVGLCLVAAFALSAISAGSASALPEVGRCVAKAGTGKYKNSNCTEKAGKLVSEKAFEWVKNPIKKGFKASGGVSILEGASGTQIECKTNASSGEYLSTTSTKEVHKVVARFNECGVPAFGGTECKTKGDAAGEINTTSLKGKMAYTSGKGTKSPVVNQALVPELKKHGFTQFECPALGIVVYVGEGLEKGHETILANVGHVNEMSLTNTQNFEGSKGVQNPQHVEGSIVIDNLESSLAGPKGTFERSDQSQFVTIENEEELEIKA